MIKNNLSFHAVNADQVDAVAPPRVLAYVIYSLVALFLFYEMALQVSPSVMTQQLMQDLQIQATGLGIISGIYFYSYMFMQIPSGLLFDRLQTRMVTPIAILICVLGTLFFAISTTAYTAAMGRFLMGIGSSCAFISVLVVSSRWFPARYFALLVGIAQLLAAAGAMGGEAPLSAFIHALGWRHALYWLIGVGVLLAIVIWLVLKNDPAHPRYNQKSNEIKNFPSATESLKTIIKSSQSWWIALYAFCGWGPVVTFAGLWGVPYLMNLYQVNSTLAATVCAMVWVGLMIGSPFFGWYSSRFGKRRPFLQACSLLGVIVAIIILYVPHIPLAVMFVLLLLFGIATSGHILTFALAKENHPLTVTATAVGFNNMAVVAGGAIFQPLVGFLLHLSWNGQMMNGTPLYTVNNYRAALFIVPLCFLVGWIVSQFFIGETYCQSKFSETLIGE